MKTYKREALKKLISEWDNAQAVITSIQEVRWLGQGVLKKKHHIETTSHILHLPRQETLI